MKLHTLVLAAGAVLSVGIAIPAVAGPLEDRMEATLAAQARISPAEAAEIAQRHVKDSRMVSLELDFKRARLVYEIEVITVQNVAHEVYVDANSGRVIASQIEWDD